MGEATTSVSKRREGVAKYVSKLGGAEEKAVSEAKLEGRASSGTNPNQDTTGPCQAMGTWLLTRVLEKVSQFRSPSQSSKAAKEVLDVREINLFSIVL